MKPKLINNVMLSMAVASGIDLKRVKEIEDSVSQTMNEIVFSYADIVEVLSNDLKPTLNEWCYIFYYIGVYTNR